MFTNKKREGINRFVCDASLYVAKTPKASIKYHKPPLPIIPCGIVAYGFVGQPISKQLYSDRFPRPRSLVYRSLLLFRPISVIFGGKCLKQLSMHFCG